MLLKNWVLAMGVLLIFIAGIYFGKNFQNNHAEEPQTAKGQKSLPHETSATSANAARSASISAAQKKSGDPIEPAVQAVLEKIHQAKNLPDGSRTTPLLKALEDTTKLPLTKELLDEFSSIISDGEIESSNYILSILEQREEKSSVDFLLQVSANNNQDVAQRALFALEAVAGTVFPNRDAAVAWAATWVSDPERAKLFSPSQGTDHDNLTDDIPRIPDPRGKKKTVDTSPSNK